MSGLNVTDGGMDTARVPAAASQAEQEHRADRDRTAVRYLTRRGYADLIPVLGLDHAAPTSEGVA